MKKSDIINLREKIEKCINDIKSFEERYCKVKKDFCNLGMTQYELTIISKTIVDYYTSLETVFLRISQSFENHLDKNRWHSHLLDKMILEVPNIRKRVIKDKTYDYLKEIMKFRHFYRYYFAIDYDEGKIKELEISFLNSTNLIVEDFEEYKKFINELENINKE